MVDKVEYIGHTKKDESGNITAIQSLKDHLMNTKAYAEKYAAELEASHIAGLVGMIHDIGKFQKPFQEYIRDKHGRRGSVDHATFGGMFIKQYIKQYVASHNINNVNKQKYDIFQDLLTNAIFSHHNSLGLKDYFEPDGNSPFLNRISKFEKKPENLKELESIKNVFYTEIISKERFNLYFEKAFQEFDRIFQKIVEIDSGRYSALYLSFLGDYIYSCLLDADRTDATCFQFDKELAHKDTSKLFEEYYNRLVKKLSKMNETNSTEINKNRAEMSQECDDFATKNSSIYTLSMPCGGGKTLASMRLALKHANLHNKKRIIYVLPYITIIEQNAQVFRDVLNGNDMDTSNILEFHSNVSQELKNSQSDIESQNLLDLAEDNWDSPIIVTTMVQFLNTIYASGTTNRRRLHNLCDSVIVFDEIQKLPIRVTDLFNVAINFLQEIGKSNIILCTATQPSLGKNSLIDDENNEYALHISSNPEIILDLAKRTEQFKRIKFIDDVTVKRRLNSLSIDEAAQKIVLASKHVSSILAIFNTISATEKVYKKVCELLEEQDCQIQIYYLSTRMCPAHRKRVISNLRECLKNNIPVICISTPLIEAGVDISFQEVFRSLCGLDSIIQSAGRCNRNFENKVGKVHLILMDEKAEFLGKGLDTIKEGQEITKWLLQDKVHSADDLLNNDVIKLYFDNFYGQFNENEVTKGTQVGDYGLVDYISGLKFGLAHKQEVIDSDVHLFSDFETIAENFEVIDKNTTSVLVQYDDNSKEIVSALNGHIEKKTDLKELMKQAQPYLVNVFKNTLDDLIDEGAVMTIIPEKFNSKYGIYALKEDYYDKKIGITPYKSVNFDSKIF